MGALIVALVALIVVILGFSFVDSVLIKGGKSKSETKSKSSSGVKSKVEATASAIKAATGIPASSQPIPPAIEPVVDFVDAYMGASGAGKSNAQIAARMFGGAVGSGKENTNPNENQMAGGTKNLTIYNSELADDLDKILKDSNVESQTRIKIGNHINKESNIAKYLKEKNYHTFNFNDQADDDNDDDETPEGFTAEDYKRVVALSNIVDKK